jgi:hypothetical protein
MKYFKTYPFTGNEESQEEGASFFYRIVKASEHNFQIVENVLNGRIRSVAYRNMKDVSLDVVQEYHSLNYGELDLFQVEEKLFKGVIRITDYQRGVVLRFYIFHLTDFGKVKKQQWYDKNFNLLEYHEEVYENNQNTEKKIFYPTSWNISSNRLI